MAKHLPLEGRIAIVTGASRGIGAGIAERLGSAGATVVVAARTLKGPPGVGTAEETVARITDRGGKAVAIAADIEDAGSREALIAQTIERYGRIDILVSNAGTANYIATDEMPLAIARSQTDIYFFGPWHLFHLVLPHMKRAGRGWILQVGSCAVANPEPPYADYNAVRGHETLYAAVKAAVHRLATGLAAEVFDHNIAVNVVAPVLAVYTPGLASLNLGLTPDHPIVEPVEDISEAALSMLSHEPQAYTGQVEFSHQYLDRIGRPTRSLDGETVIKPRSPKVKTMRALVMTGFGAPAEKIAVEDVPFPPCEANDVLVRVAAAGINPVDWKECEGFLEPFYGKYAEKWIPGYDAAGVVEAVGATVTAFRPGDRVVVFSDRRENGHNGAFAEYVRVLANGVAKVPDTVDLAEAAAMPTAALTGYQALIAGNKAALKAGDRVLIHGAAGGVGSYAVQFAKSFGLKVAATCSARNADFVKSLGADQVIDYGRGDIVRAVRAWAPDGVHAIIDCVSGSTLPEALDALRPGGKLISIATLTQDGDIEGDTARAAERGFEKIFSIINFDRIDKDLAEIMALMANGKVRSPPLTRYPLDRGGEALEHMKRGGVRGKIVLTI